MSTVTVDPFDLARAEALLRGYDARWSDSMADYEVLAIEVEFRTALINPLTRAASRTWRLGGKLDGVVRELSTDRVLVLEHKTAAADIRPGSEYWKRLRIDGQVSIYFEGARSLGFDVEGCLYDVLAKPEQRPRQVPLTDEAGQKIVLGADGARVRTKDGKKWRETADAAAGHVLQSRPETPDEYLTRMLDAIAEDPMGYYQRGDVVRLEAEVDEAGFDVWQLGKQIREADLAGRFPRNPDACVRYGQTCAFFDVCTGTASLQDESRFTRSRRLHPELQLVELEEIGGGHDLLSASRLSAARACQRLHKYRYFDGYRPAVEAEPLRFGSLIHRGLEAWWKAPEGERLEAALAALVTPNPQPQLAEASA